MVADRGQDRDLVPDHEADQGVVVLVAGADQREVEQRAGAEADQ